MKKTVALTLVALLASVLPAAPVSSQTDPVYTVNGSGWGHAVGMSQYGARALARTGSTHSQILSYYYAGVTVKHINQVFADPLHWLRSDPAPLWVNIAASQASLGFTVAGGNATPCNAVDPCPLQPAQPGEAWEFRALGGGACQFFNGGAPVGNPGPCHADISWGPQPGTRVTLAGHGEYGRGTIRLRPVGEGFHVVLQIGIEEYLYGLGEMPSDWHAEALKAQAIAGRAYGLRQALVYGPEASMSADRRAQCWCQLWDSTVDQAYVGWLKENDPVDANWVAAVNGTAGVLVTHPQAPESTVIIAYYSSSSGGHTISNVEGFGHTFALPYLVGVDDPWSVDPLAENPNAAWTRNPTASEIALAFGLETVTGVAVTSRNPSGTVAQVTITGTLGGAATTITRTGRSFRSGLGLRSIFFDIQAPTGATLPPGQTTDLCKVPLPPDAGFTDVSAASVHKADIDCVAFITVMHGVGGGQFAPTLQIPRRHMALLLVRTLQRTGVPLPVPSDQGFTDISGLTQAEQDAINQLAMVGITTGTGPGTFSPLLTVDRWQMAIFLMRLHQALGEAIPATSDVFTDLGAHPAETVLAINQLHALGVTNGCATTPAMYCPDRKVTRQEMASFVARLVRLDT